MIVVRNRLRCIDGAAAAHAHKHICPSIFKCLHACPDTRDGRVLADLPERCPMRRPEYGFDTAHDIGLGVQASAGDD